MEGCDAAVNAVGLYIERRTDTFRNVHELGAMHVARQSARAGVKALVHLSGIGADLNSQSSYVRGNQRGRDSKSVSLISTFRDCLLKLRTVHPPVNGIPTVNISSPMRQERLQARKQCVV